MTFNDHFGVILMPHFDVMTTYCYNSGSNFSEKFSDTLQIYNRISSEWRQFACIAYLPWLCKAMLYPVYPCLR